MSDAPSIETNINPSQTGGPGIVTPADAAPVNGSAAPAATSQDAPSVVALASGNAAPEAPKQEPQAPAQNAQPKVEKVPSAQDEAGVVVYDETGDAGLDLALGFIGRLGISGDDPAMVAAANGDFSFLEAKLSTLGDEARGWEKHVQLGKEAHARQLSKFNDEQAATNRAVHAIVGGEANWKALVEWAGANADPSEKQALNAMFDAGGFQAQAAARAILSAYQSAKGTTITPANPASQVSGVAAQPQGRMSQADYHKAVSDLYSKMGNAMDASPEYADLKRRAFGR